MFKIDRTNNTIEPLKKMTFSQLGVRERDHLQEWIAKHPDCLGEELLILQKEFAGFDKTQERLDLLAMDKHGALVVIENKLDDSGRDVAWQSLKYASYCSRLSAQNIKALYQQYLDAIDPGADAEVKITEFLGIDDYQSATLNTGISQRIILIAAHFRSEVTNSVMWLLNFNIQIQCMRTTPFAMDDQLFLNIEQIIPMPDAEEYMIGMAEKAQDDIVHHKGDKALKAIQKAFWAKLLPKMNATECTLFRNISPQASNWIAAATGYRRIGYNFVISKAVGRIELYIDYGEADDNACIFDSLLTQRAKIEESFGGPLLWERLESRRACRIKHETSLDLPHQETWPDAIDQMVASMVSFDAAISENLSAAVSMAGRLDN